MRPVRNCDVSSRHDITNYHEIPAAKNGVIDMTQIKVKAMYASEVFDVSQEAKHVLGNEVITIETPNTRPGLTYDFYESDDLTGLMNSVH